MSILPIFSSVTVGLLLLSLFTWNILLLDFVLCCLVFLIVIYIFESMSNGLHFVSSFWLFIFSEVAVFGSLIFCCLYFDYEYYPNLSSALELPFLGCFILLGSSLTVTCYHHLINWSYSWVCLFSTIILGFSFVFLQMFEMEEIIMNIVDTTFHASSLCTIGLHFSHVILGVVGLTVILILGVKNLGHYRCSIVVWYWHFVDYVWLFVYTFVYIC
uniref:Cytochrome c oxidase subunit 3 n=1 Tax=Fimbriaria fasciolaris TaxID=2572217 RepID=A0A4P8JCR6_9CEST|nr:cytochrome c oxidase subunit 3 [Fimbriaria fasciolaris]